MLLTPSLTYALFGSLREGVPVWSKAQELPGYLTDTFLRLDFGVIGPPTQPETVRHAVLSGLPVDLALLAGGLVVGLVAGIASGLAAGPRRRSAADRAMTVGSAVLMSAPVYWLAIVGLYTFSPVIGTWALPFGSAYGGYVPLSQDPLGWLQSLWMPWLVLGAPLAAMSHRMVRATLADLQNEDYLRTARAKGLRGRVVQRRHALPATLPPVLGLLSVNMALMVTNVALIEPAFNLPGAFRAADVGMFLGEQAPPIEPQVVQALVVEAAVLIAGFVLVCDLLQARLDPRVALRG